MNTIKKNLVVIVQVIAVILVLVPMIYLFQFAVMNADDFIYGDTGREVWQSTHSFGAVIKNAVNFSRTYYDIWQGSFFSVFMMTMQPGIFSITAYRITLFVMFLLCIITPIFALLAFNKFYLKSKNRYILPYGLLYIIMVTQYMPSVFEAYYWYNSAIYYQFTFCMIMLYLIVSMHMNNSKKQWLRVVLTVILALLCITIGASNYVTGIAFILLYALYVLKLWIKKADNKYIHTGLFAFVSIIFLISVLAPGNAQRAANHIQPALHYVAYCSVRDFVLEASQSLSNGIAVGVLMIFSLWSHQLVKNAKIKFWNPVITAIIIVAVLIAQYVPTIYGLATKGPQRCENIRYMSLQISLIILAINIYGWLNQNKKLIKPNVIIVVFVSIFMLSSSINAYPITSMWSYKAADYYIGGSIHTFAERIDERLEKFEDTTSNEPLAFETKAINEILHHSDDLWFHYGIWDFYDKLPKRD